MKLNLKSAVNGLNAHHNVALSLNTLDFGRVQPTMVIDTIPRDNITKCTVNGFMRLTPTNFPPFGRAYVKTAAFYVPDNKLTSDADAWHQGLNVSNGFAVGAPHILASDINRFFAIRCTIPNIGIDPSSVQSVFPDSVIRYTGEQSPSLGKFVGFFDSSSSLNNVDYDFTFPNPLGSNLPSGYNADMVRKSGQTIMMFKLNQRGRDIFSVIKSLGYEFRAYTKKSSTYTVAGFNTHVSENDFYLQAFDLLAYGRMIVDYYTSGADQNVSALASILDSIYRKQDIVQSDLYSGGKLYNATPDSAKRCYLHFELVARRFREMTPLFEDNLFNNAWADTNSVNGSTINHILPNTSAGLISPVTDSIGTNAYGNLKTLNETAAHNTHQSLVLSNNVTFSAAGHRALMAFDSWVRRKNLAGSTAIKQIYAAFGVEPDDARFRTCTNICNNSQPINFSTVVSNSDTRSTRDFSQAATGRVLGDMSGYCQAPLNYEFSYACKDYGRIILVAWLNIDPLYYRGFHARTLRTSYMDYYQPEWDGNAFRPIPYAELSAPCTIKPRTDNTFNPTSVFGYINLYDDYRVLRDNVSGDFIMDKALRDSFFGINPSSLLIGNNNITPQSHPFKYFEPSSDQGLSNPFIYAHTLGDRVQLSMSYTLDKLSPAKQPSDTFNLGTGDTTIQKNGDGIK